MDQSYYSNGMIGLVAVACDSDNNRIPPPNQPPTPTSDTCSHNRSFNHFYLIVSLYIAVLGGHGVKENRIVIEPQPHYHYYQLQPYLFDMYEGVVIRFDEGVSPDTTEGFVFETDDGSYDGDRVGL